MLGVCEISFASDNDTSSDNSHWGSGEILLAATGGNNVQWVSGDVFLLAAGCGDDLRWVSGKKKLGSDRDFSDGFDDERPMCA